MSAHLLAVPPSLPLEVHERFQRRKKLPCQTTLTVTNPSSRTSAAYKIKTNQPRRYAVSPTLGVIGPGASAKVTVTLDAAHIKNLRTAFEIPLAATAVESDRGD